MPAGRKEANLVAGQRKPLYSEAVTVGIFLTVLALFWVVILLITRPKAKARQTRSRSVPPKLVKSQEDVLLERLMSMTLGNRGPSNGA